MTRKLGRNERQVWGSLVLMLGLIAIPGGTREVSAQTAPDGMAESITPIFLMIERSFVALAEAMPSDRYDFRPTNGAFEGVRSFGEQVKHVACSNFAFFNEVEGLEPPDACASGGPHSATTKAELVAYLRESFLYGARVIGEMTPTNALQPTDGPYGGKSTRLTLTTLAVWHASDHYGQLVVYLRLNGYVPPASRSSGAP
ncbi:MAG: DinB family protein [Longimicrobiales bacterium]